MSAPAGPEQFDWYAHPSQYPDLGLVGQLLAAAGWDEQDARSAGEGDGSFDEVLAVVADHTWRGDLAIADAMGLVGDWGTDDVSSLRGDAEHPRTPCFMPWFLGVSPEEFRAQAPEVTPLRPDPAEEPDAVAACLNAVALVLHQHGWAMGASDLRVLARQLRDVPAVRASVSAALAHTAPRSADDVAA